MKLEAALWQRSYLYFVLFFLLAIFGFWLTYFTRIFEQESYRMHLHGLALILWCLMLIVQPYLIRTKKNRLHKSIGKFSYLLMPLMPHLSKCANQQKTLRYRWNNVSPGLVPLAQGLSPNFQGITLGTSQMSET